MAKIKGQLSEDWIQLAGTILKAELDNIDKDQVRTFFESASTLMANQVRDLIELSI
jgi:hypothetical protein